MSFRRRLTLFFLLIVVLPMIVLGVLVVDVTEESTTGKADARLDAQLAGALAIYEDSVVEARRAADALAGEEELATALEEAEPGALEDALGTHAPRHGITSARLRDHRGNELAAFTAPRRFASSEVDLTRDGETIGTLEVSTTSVEDYLRDIDRTAEHAVIASARRPLGGTLEVPHADLPAAGEAHHIEIGDRTLRALAASLPGAPGLRLVMLGQSEQGGFMASSPRVAAVLLAFFAVALFFVVMLTRSLHGQVETMLDAARRIGEGDFGARVPVVGRDEMAGLASEFNRMSDRLSAQMEELKRQRDELERSMRRLGEAFAAGLDRTALMKIIAETAISACEAEYGLLVLTGRAGAEAQSGSSTPTMQEIALAAEERSLREGSLIAEADGDVHAISVPLLPMIGRAEHRVGVMTVARRGEAFSKGEHDVLRYLAGQAAASLENVALHEQVSEQAVTDELTGLANSRAFRELIQREAVRAMRFGHDLSVLLLDIDDFKDVNDTYGHLQGDEILRVVGRILRSESRGVDEPARYGGEEFAVALPETATDGAVEVAERIRSRLAGESIPLIVGGGEVRVTASIGVATLPDAAEDVWELIAAADAALYAAKRAGKNEVHAAQGRTGARRS